jgi:Uma2 family endonuclease
LWKRERVELIEGELISKMPKKRPHVVVFMSVLEWLAGVFGMKRLNAEGSIDVSPEDNPTSEPEPDIAVLVKPGLEYVGANPPASDVRLVIEVSDSTLAFDLGPKARLYARAGIPSHSVVTAYSEVESVKPLAMPSATFLVSLAFPFPATGI